MKLYGIESGFQAGAYNMALDEALLEFCRAASEPLLIVRTYCWERSTLSLGVHQPQKDIAALLRLYGLSGEKPDVVRRPTGGRAILHGADVSFSFITNAPALTRLPLKESYARLTGFVRDALQRLSVAVLSDTEVSDRDYLRSPICFETHTASDLIGANGQKLAGSAQLRRAGGLLQHGAAFLKPHGIGGAHFTRALFTAVSACSGGQVKKPALPSFPLESLEPGFSRLLADYIKVSGVILESASTTSGSHLEPASC